MNGILSTLKSWNIPLLLIGAALVLFLVAYALSTLRGEKQDNPRFSRDQRNRLFVIAGWFLIVGLVIGLLPASPPVTTTAQQTVPPTIVAPTSTSQAVSQPTTGRTAHGNVNANQGPPGVDTKVDLTAGEHLTIAASGQASYGYMGTSCVGYPQTNPDGQSTLNGTPCPAYTDQLAVLPSAPIGTLLATIVSSGTPDASSSWFVVGSNYEASVTTSGRLYLLYNDVAGGYQDNSGAYQVTVTVQ